MEEVQCQRLISIFGDFITSIALKFDHLRSRCRNNKNARQIYEELLEEIARNSQSLIEIKFYYFSVGKISKFLKPLPKVKSITLERCDLDDETVLLSEIFPKLEHLKISHDFHYMRFNRIINHFPYLKELGLNSVYTAESICVDSFIKLNPQFPWEQSPIDSEYVYFTTKTSQLETFELHFNPPDIDESCQLYVRKATLPFED